MANTATNVNNTNGITRLRRKVVDILDCPCSALSLNCFQFGCFIQNVPRHHGFFSNADSNSNADWMHHLLQIQPNVKLGSLCIPASHDSASDTISPFKAFSAVGRTQNVSVAEQLIRGVRSLDIRMATSTTGSVGIFHGCLMGAPLYDVLQQIADFLYQHPSEFLFCEMVPEFGRHFSPIHKKEALDMMQECLGPFLYKCNGGNDNCNKLLNECTLQNLVSANTRLCLLVHPRMYQDFELDGVVYNRDFVATSYHCFDSNKAMHSQWHNTRDCNLLLQWNLEEIQRRRGGPAQPQRRDHEPQILVNQFVLTPGVGGPGDIFMLLLGFLSLRPVSFAVKLIPGMEEFFRAHAHEPWNLVMMDFIDLVPGLVTFLISLNFVAELRIVKATIFDSNAPRGSVDTDVTDAVAKFVYRNKVLFLSSVTTDLCSTTNCALDGRLRIDFQLLKPNHPIDDDVMTHTMEWEFDDDTQIVLSEYTHMMAPTG